MFSSSATRCRRSSMRRPRPTARSRRPRPTAAIVVYTSTQALFFSLDTCAKILDVPSNKLHFIGGTVGGGFGGKVDTVTEPLSILGAMLTGRPVRYVIGREEEMQYCAPRGAERIFIKDGVSRDGRIVARKFRCYFDSGAYTRLSSYAAVKCAAHLPGPYTIPNVYADVYCVFTNRVPATAMRGFGVTAVDFAIECQMDKLAHLVGMDPMEFRLLNAYRDGDMKAHRREAKNTALIECVQVAAEKAKWPIRDEFKRMSSRKDGGGAARRHSADAARLPVRPARGRAAAHDLRSADRPRRRRLRRVRRRLPPSRRRRRRMGRHGSLRSSAGGADMAKLRGRGMAVDQLPDRHESRRRPEPGAGPFQSERQVHRRAVLDRSRPGDEVGDPADLRRNARRAGRGRLCRHRQFRHRAALHGQFRLARHPSRRQCGGGGRPRSPRA